MAQAGLALGPQERHDLDAAEESLPVLVQGLKAYGNTFRVPSATRPADALFINDPDDVKRVLLTHRANYVKGAGLERVRMLLGNGLIVSDGDLWARQRRMMQPAFTGQANRGFVPLIQRSNAALLERWAESAATGEPINLTQDLSALALDIVLRALFSVDFDRLLLAEGQSPFDLLAEESQRDLQFAVRFRGLTRFVRAIIDTRRREERVESDWLSAMMQARDKSGGGAMPDRALLDEVMTLIVAGHETTASTLNWMWYLVCRDPQMQRALQEAVAGVSPTAAATDADQGEPEAGSFVEQLLQEALRLYPPVWLFSRRAVQEDVLGGYHVPAGTDIFISPYLLHRSAPHWDQPDEFMPSRFGPEASASRHRFAYLPFSAGPRFCIGAGFAMSEMAMHVTMVAQRFELCYAGDEPARPEFQINLRTRHPVRVRLVPRS